MFTIVSLFIICALFASIIDRTDNKSVKNVLIFLCLLFLALVSGTRLVGGTDRVIYRGEYYSEPDFLTALFTNQNDLGQEKGYVLISMFFRGLGISFEGFCLIQSFFFYFIFWKSLSRYTNLFGLVILVFLYKLFFYNTFISMRQSITVVCFFYIVRYIEEKKILKYYLCCFLLSTIHNGAFLLFILYPLAYIRLNKSFIGLLNLVFIPTILVGFAGIDVIGPIGSFLHEHAMNDRMVDKSEKFFIGENLSPIGIFHTFEYFLLMLLFYLKADKLDYTDNKVHTIIWLFLCLLPLFTLLRGSEILTREKDYFTIFYAVILYYILPYYEKSRGVIYTSVVLLCAFGYYRFAVLFDDGAMLRYSSWLFNPSYSFFIE